MTRVLLSVAGIMGLTVATWALEGQIVPNTPSHGEQNFLIKIGDVKQSCEKHNHESGQALDPAIHKDGKTITGSPKRHRDPAPAERLGLMLRLTSL